MPANLSNLPIMRPGVIRSPGSTTSRGCTTPWRLTGGRTAPPSWMNSHPVSARSSAVTRAIRYAMRVWDVIKAHAPNRQLCTMSCGMPEEIAHHLHDQWVHIRRGLKAIDLPDDGLDDEMEIEFIDARRRQRQLMPKIELGRREGEEKNPTSDPPPTGPKTEQPVSQENLDPSPSDFPLPRLPELDDNLYAIHVSQELQENSPDQTPPVSAIVIQQVRTDRQRSFSAFKILEQSLEKGCDVKAAFLNRAAELEKRMFEDFCSFVSQNPQIVWLHWAMRQPRFGFEVLAQRARLHGIEPAGIPPMKEFNLCSYLKRRYGEEFVPHHRLENLIKINGYWGDEILDKDAAKEAWQNGEYHKLLNSLGGKVDAIADLFLRTRQGTLRTGRKNSTHATRMTAQTPLSQSTKVLFPVERCSHLAN